MNIPKHRGQTEIKWVGMGLGLLLFVCRPATAQSVEYIHTDALGTPVVVTDADRNVLETSEYEPFGKLLNRAATDEPGYTGHVSDAATGLDYMQQRYYDPGIGRFLSVDPVTADGNNGANFNRYKYAANNPYLFTDPDGRADVNYFNRGDFFHDAAERFDIPGFTTVMGHSWSYAFRDDRDLVGGPQVSYASLSRDIAATYNKKDYIFLGGCNLGMGNVDAKLAKDFNTKVISSTGYVKKSESSNGDFTYYANSRSDGSGSARWFQVTTPDGNSSGKIGSITKHTDGSVTFTAAQAQTGTHIRSQVTIAADKETHDDN